MSYESEERLMVQGIENDAKRWPAHGEIPPTHEELVKVKHDKERQKMMRELCDAIVEHFADKKRDTISGVYLEVTDFIKGWQPKEKHDSETRQGTAEDAG